MRFVGIDAPEGIAVWDSKAQCLLNVQTTNFWEIVDRLKLYCKFHGAKVYIEAPQENAPVWNHRTVKSERVFAKICQDVGENKGAAKLLIELCGRLGIECVAVRPTKSSMTKLKADVFAKLTGWTKRTSEHGRDAAMLVFGR